MNVDSSLVMEGKAAELGETPHGPLDASPVTSQSLPALDPVPVDAGLDTTTGERLTATALVAAFVVMQLRGPLARSSPP